MKKPLFIVLDGNDGSGKATQSRLLQEYLEQKGIETLKVDFPSYDTNFFGAFIGECLAGKHGNFVELDPKIASTLYAVDRMESAPRVRAALEDGKTIIADRYASSNQIHQGGKIDDEQSRIEFLTWLDRMEYEVLGIPRPDTVIYLRMPLEASLKLLSEKRLKKNHALGTEVDTVESDLQYMQRSHATANWLAEREGTWRIVECERDGSIRSIDDIQTEIAQIVQDLL